MGHKMNSKVSLTRRDLLSAGVNLSVGSLLAHSAVGRSLTLKGVEQEADPAEVPAIRFDVRGAGLKPEVTSTLAKWGGKGAGGQLTANTCHLERDGHPFGIVAGELHPQRVPVEEWEDAILQMKAAGLNTISCYIFWSPIERQRGRYDFSERNNIGHFVELCQLHGLLVILRIGPFANAEFLLGGLPPWLYGLPTTERSNDALYLKLVGLYYAALGGQLRDLLWENGGPIAIIQLENELSVAPVEWNRPFLYAASVTGHMGPTGEAFTEHYRRLHELAISGGLRAPFYSVTGWGTDDLYPIEVVMPTFGGYMDLSPAGPQNSGLTLFNFESRAYDGKVPIGFIEIGYGSPARESFRPRPLADSGYTSTLTLFGASRSLMVGYYMFRGGSNPVNGDIGWTIKNATYPLISYDFWAPISEFGEWRPAVFRARPFNLFIQNYAAELARTEARAPAQPVTQADDDRPRAEARITEGRGFVFFCNYGNVHPLSERRRFSIELETEKGVVRIPRATDMTLPSGAVGVWPVHLDLGAGVTLISATGQPVCRFTYEGVPWHIFSQVAGLPAEFVFATPATVDPGPHGQLDAAHADTIVARLEPARDSVLEARGADGRKVRLLLLSETDAGRLAQLGIPASPLLALSDAIVTRSGNALGVVTRQLADLAVSLFPAQALPASVSKPGGACRGEQALCRSLRGQAALHRL
jgi:hypothetical protein